MAQATFSIRMDENLKRQFDALCADFGMNATTAFNIFARAVVRERKIPFQIEASNDLKREDGVKAFMALRAEAKTNGIQDMTLEEINEEIRPEAESEVAADWQDIAEIKAYARLGDHRIAESE